MKLRYKVLIFSVIPAFIIVILGLVKGCVSVKLPPKLTQEEKVIVSGAYMPLSVGVREYKQPKYFELLARALIGTGIFKKVDRLKNFEGPPDLVAEVEEEIRERAVFPLLTIVTLGFFPTWTEQYYGQSFSLRSEKRLENKIPIQFIYSGNTFLGWISGIINLVSSDRTDCDSVGCVDEYQYRQALAYAIALKRADILDTIRDQPNQSLGK